MRWIFLVLISVLALVGCQEKVASQAKTIEKKEVKKVEPPKQAIVRQEKLISDDNVTDTLLAYGKANRETIVDITTSFGKIRVKLFEDTPLHRANFIMLTKEHYFDSTVFNRVVPKFMAQCGAGSIGRHTDYKRDHGRYTIPSEILPGHFHVKGAVAMARSYKENPNKRSDPYAFYFVEGQRFSNETLDIYEETNHYKYSKEQRKYYPNNPGAAHIDGEHTVFGQVISGFSVIPKITAVDTDGQDWPREDIYILSVEIIE